ncbi:MAG: hypothetical protein K2X47_14750 [Bdellovibrionales bacterium]|nr:hypothetical protein [Bdellovibrionales bacterium]
MKLAAIDVGSNAIRFVLAESSFDGSLEILKAIREPIRLGRDVFKTGTISEKSFKEATKAFQKFAKIIQKHKVIWVKAVATSAMRDAKNGVWLQERISQRTGIHICIISGEEEARLINRAVDQRISTKGRKGAYIDIGGGSLELSLISNQKLIATRTFKMGTVRTLQAARLGDKETSVVRIQTAIRKHLPEVSKFLRAEKNTVSQISVLAGTGGNIEALGKLRVEALGRATSQFITLEELDDLISLLGRMSYAERVKKLDLRPDRADVIIPAAVAVHAVMKLLKKHDLSIPFVGLKDGVLLELNDSLSSSHQMDLCNCQFLEQKKQAKSARTQPTNLRKMDLNGFR